MWAGRLATSRPLGERSDPFLAAKRPTASDEVPRHMKSGEGLFSKSSGRAKICDTQRWGGGGGGGEGSIISFLFSIPFAHRPLPFSNKTERAGQTYQGQRFYSQDHPSSSEETLEELGPR